MLIKPNYHYSKAYTDFTQSLIFSEIDDFNTQVLAQLKFRCDAVLNGALRHPELHKAEMPGFAIASTRSRSKWNSVSKDNFLATSMLVLDIDEVPEDVRDIRIWLEPILPQDVYCFWYSTPRATVAEKRIRAVIPLSRAITMDEKASLEYRLKIPGLDPASFEAAKFSLLPNWCAETSVFCYGEFGSRPLDPDKDLPEYARPSYQSTPNVFYNTRSAGVIPLMSLIEQINNAPNGHSQEVIKPGLARLLSQYPLTMHDLEFRAHLIIREDRRKDYLGIGAWILRQRERS